MVSKEWQEWIQEFRKEGGGGANLEKT